MAIVFSANGLVITSESLGSGTGNYSTFLRLDDTGQSADNHGPNAGVEVGFNTDAGSETLISGLPSDVVNTFTSAVKLSDIPVVNLGGVDYLQFGLDVNQAQNVIALADFKLYQAGTG